MISIRTRRHARSCICSSRSSRSWGPFAPCSTGCLPTAFPCRSTRVRGRTRASSCGTVLPRRHSVRCPPPHLRWGLCLRTTAGGSEAAIRDWQEPDAELAADGSVADPDPGPPASLYHVGTFPEQSGTTEAEPVTARYPRGPAERLPHCSVASSSAADVIGAWRSRTATATSRLTVACGSGWRDPNRPACCPCPPLSSTNWWRRQVLRPGTRGAGVEPAGPSGCPQGAQALGPALAAEAPACPVRRGPRRAPLPGGQPRQPPGRRDAGATVGSGPAQPSGRFKRITTGSLGGRCLNWAWRKPHASLRLASDIPALWHSPHTTNADRQAILRCLVERVVIEGERRSERVAAAIHWAGGYESRIGVRSARPQL